MKRVIKRYWNFKVQGVPKFSLIFLKVSSIRFYELISSIFWKFNLGSCGKNVFIQKGTSIIFPGNLKIEDDVSIGRNCQISSEFCDSLLSIGTGSRIDKKCLLDYSGNLIISNNVTISEGVMIETHSHGYNPRNKPIKMPLHIKQNVWIGAHVIILPSVEFIGENSIIGAGSIVTKNVDANTIVVGNPAKLLKKI